MKFDFYKYQGTGNDFVIIDNRANTFPKEDVLLVKKICDRRFGVGADGLILLEADDKSDFMMVYYNSDGNISSMCGNGGRCMAAFAYSKGVSPKRGSFNAIDGLHQFEMIDFNNVKLKMNDVNDIEKGIDHYILDTGSPHYVVFAQQIEQVDLITEARSIRYNDRFKEKGINVNIAELKGDELSMRTYERGVENETLSCGTGTVAVAISDAFKHNKSEGGSIINTPGGILQVHYKRVQDTFVDIWLEGPAERVFKGIINTELL